MCCLYIRFCVYSQAALEATISSCAVGEMCQVSQLVASLVLFIMIKSEKNYACVYICDCAWDGLHNNVEWLNLHDGFYYNYTTGITTCI